MAAAAYPPGPNGEPPRLSFLPLELDPPLHLFSPHALTELAPWLLALTDQLIDAIIEMGHVRQAGQGLAARRPASRRSRRGEGRRSGRRASVSGDGDQRDAVCWMALPKRPDSTGFLNSIERRLLPKREVLQRKPTQRAFAKLPEQNSPGPIVSFVMGITRCCRNVQHLREHGRRQSIGNSGLCAFCT